MAIILDEPSLIDNFLYYGLFLGAIFQIVCIAAVIFIPQSENEEELPEETSAEMKSPGSTSRPTSSGKKQKIEKKKKR
ncbi:hypothetical protein DPMN_118329 [Dreissena polymorpha]|uniref:Protein anon-73B1 n=1 Tax=Dreissena polymorpha TaxID=45954 RepID=A0A9D4GJW2_DREPO|nr:hypothetical protein DPMN_118329 [Dreissena polymorpha]